MTNIFLRTRNRRSRFFIAASAGILVLQACTSVKKITASGKEENPALSALLANPAFQSAHAGISIFDITASKEVVNHQADKFFVPASNTKIVTCYAAMKELGDSSLTFQYAENDTAIFIKPAGDPSLMHRDFTLHPAFEWMKQQKKSLYITTDHWKTKMWGSGWAWSDYDASYMPERSALPVFGNTTIWEQVLVINDLDEEPTPAITTDPAFGWLANFSIHNPDSSFKITRALASNEFTIYQGKEDNAKQEVPFVTDNVQTAAAILSEILEKPVREWNNSLPARLQWKNIYNQPLDSILKPMMQRSDNFMAEQLLLMVSYAQSGILSERAASDSLMKSVFADMAQTPRWADGSGLSRYNLFTPQNFVSILNKMHAEIGMSRIKTVFPTGGTGTLSSYYKAEQPYIFAKTGTLSGVVALSGFLYGQSGKLYSFSILVNNHRSDATSIRRAIETYLTSMRSSL